MKQPVVERKDIYCLALAADIRTAKAALEVKDNYKNIASISNDLNNALTGIMGYVALSSDENNSDLLRGLMKDIAKLTAKAVALNQLLRETVEISCIRD